MLGTVTCELLSLWYRNCMLLPCRLSTWVGDSLLLLFASGRACPALELHGDWLSPGSGPEMGHLRARQLLRE